jgi:SAM-dependent methyltransferase
MPWCLRVVVTLRIAEHIAAGTTDIDDLAAAAGCDRDVLGRVLAYLMSKGLFEEREPGVFGLNEAARGLLDPALRLGLDLDGIGGRMTGARGTLLSYVRTGVPAYGEAFGLPFWEDLDAHPAIAASFDALIGPRGHGAFNGEFDLTGGWETVRIVVDVGGGTGAMLAAILQLRTHVRGTLVDLPRTVERSAETFRAAEVEGRVTAVGQSFFEPLPPGADIYLLRGVLNNWADPEAAAILRQCAQAARPQGRVVILKSVGQDSATRGIYISDLMVGGNERSISEFRLLALQSGLEVAVAEQQPSGYFVVECWLAENVAAHQLPKRQK